MAQDIQAEEKARTDALKEKQRSMKEDLAAGREVGDEHVMDPSRGKAYREWLRKGFKSIKKGNPKRSGSRS